MIILDNSTEAQLVPIHRETEPGTPASLRLRSTVNQKDYFAEIQDKGLTDNGRYYRIAVVLPEGMPDGSYEYELMAEDAVIATGCALLGRYGMPVKEYDKIIDFIQYGEN